MRSSKHGVIYVFYHNLPVLIFVYPDAEVFFIFFGTVSHIVPQSVVRTHVLAKKSVRNRIVVCLKRYELAHGLRDALQVRLTDRSYILIYDQAGSDVQSLQLLYKFFLATV